MVWPLEAGTGATPARRAKQASEREPAGVRPGDEQLGGDDRADAGLVEQSRCERTDMREDLAFELVCFEVAAWMRRARLRSTSRVASSSALATLERRSRLQRSSSARSGSPRSSCGAGRERSRSRCAAAPALRGGRRRRSAGRPATAATPHAAPRHVAARTSHSRAQSGQCGPRRAGRLCPAAAAHAAACGRPRAPPRRARRGSEPDRRRSCRCPRSPRRGDRQRDARRSAAPRDSRVCSPPSSAPATTAPAGAVTTASTCSSRCVSTPTT